jgi:Holliday junction resolvase RusA-like endonuclease
MKTKTILSTNIQGEITTNSNKEKIGRWKNSMDRIFSSLQFQTIHDKKLRISLKFWIRKDRLQNRKNDLDNLTKPVLDSMKRVGIIEDDAFIFHLQLSKFPTTGEEELQVIIKEWN